MDITIDHKLNIIIVLLVVLLGVFLGYVIIGRGEGYALECANCLEKLDAKGKCKLINGYLSPTGCKESASANASLLAARTRYGSNLCNTLSSPLPCAGGAPAPPRGECTAEPQTQFVYVHNPDGSVYIKDGYIYSQDAQCPEGKVVIDKQVTGNVPESLYTYKCC